MKLLTLLLLVSTYVIASVQASSSVPANLISLNPLSEENSVALVMDKSQYELSLYGIANDKIKKIKSFHAIFAKNLGDKYYQGDLKTPEGIYFISEIKEDSVLLPKFGKAALVLNYPNPIDKLKGKTGLGIWLHAVEDPSRLKRLNDTKGCIAVNNHDILELAKTVHIRNTPVIITEKPIFYDNNARLDTNKYFTKLIHDWKNAWMNHDIEKYISFYSDNFYSTAKHKNKAQWKSYKEYLGKAFKNKIKIEVDRINTFNFGSYATILLRQYYQSPGISDTGKKILYLEKQGSEFKIVSESWFRLKNTTTLVKSGTTQKVTN
jgi:murein L,D-transpeptidase YafK